MNYQHIIYKKTGAIAKVWLNRPEKHNAFNPQIIEELLDCLNHIHNNESIRVMVLGSKGKTFSAGADLNWMKEAGQADAADNYADSQRLALLFSTLDKMRCPTIARVQGAALGGGFGLAVVCDICVASDQAHFATSEVRLGLAPSTISPYVIRAIGARQASRYFLTGELINAKRANKLGIAHIVTSPEQLDTEIAALINHIYKGSEYAIRASKELIAHVVDRPIDEELAAYTSKHIADLRQTEQAREGFQAFLERRKAAWFREIKNFKEPKDV
ncbi:enoyl-CoA hydratase-related protein [Brackiella oedipodis]|uniref:enoyl-CoA hydratase-related protein n=1 Tax=Brackiella oedipodis TaxID=124225 RepID=UPI00049084D2|nr:enoyl-CoA hydratase-related protein [Brackiella oedipodis]